MVTLPMIALSFEDFLKPSDSGIFREIPVNTPGKLFTSPMPTGAYDKGKKLFSIIKKHQVSHVFPLVTDGEIEKKGRSDILAEYTKRGITYTRYIIKDYQTPTYEMMKGLVKDAEQRLGNKEHLLVHCHAGVGRTSLVVACIIVAVENMSADEAINHVRANMTVNITSEQANLVRRFEKKYHSGL